MSRIHTYPNIYNLGHAAIRDILTSPVVVEEKVDGSQFSFGVFDGKLFVRSKGATIDPENPPDMFSAATTTARVLFEEGRLPEGVTFRGEVLSKPKHNVLTYDRVPKGNVILFDIDSGDQDYYNPEEKAMRAEQLGLEVVPAHYVGMLESFDQLQTLVQQESCLGGAVMEGVVIKNYALFGLDKKALMAKYVRESFREAHKIAWKKPAGADIRQEIVKALAAEARWHKAIIHMKERGELTNSPKDIGPLLKEIHADILKEETDNIKAALFKWAWKAVAEDVTRGFPEWYKSRLAQEQFDSRPRYVSPNLTEITETRDDGY